MIKVYNECKDKETTLPQPQLKLIVDDKDIYIIAVNEDGEILADIWVVWAGAKSFFVGCAKQAIETNKHSTDWAEWDSDGKFIKLI